MVAKAAETLRDAGIEESIGIVLADGGYWDSPAGGYPGRVRANPTACDASLLPPSAR
jgi:hypothetical protein